MRTPLATMCFLLFWAQSASGQDVGFSQFFAAPLYLNPALTGQTECGRIGLQYRNQWPGIGKAFVTYKLSYDQHLPEIQSGFGFQVMQDQQGNGLYSRTSAGGYLASQVQIGSSSSLAAGIKLGMLQDALDWNAIQFPDQLINIDGTTGEQPPAQTSRLTPDFGAGLLFSFDDRLLIGLSADHINRPYPGMFGEDHRQLPMRWAAHIGWRKSPNSNRYLKSDDESLVFQPNILFLQQGNFRQINAGLYVSKHQLVAGSWFRHTIATADALQVMVGMRGNGLTVGYSYDITISGVGLNAGGAHEVSLNWELCIERETKRKVRAIKAPVF